MQDQKVDNSLFSLAGILAQGTQQQPEERAVMIQLGDLDVSEEYASEQDNSGCKSKRSLKASGKMAANNADEPLPLIDAVTENDMSPGSKRPRPASPRAEFSKYYAKTLKKIEEIKKKIKGTTDKKEIKRLKNMISAYGSRLHKREDVEQLKEQVDIRNKQIGVMLKVLQQDLPAHQLSNILRRIKEETPTINRQASQD